jgi:type III secretion protein W
LPAHGTVQVAGLLRDQLEDFRMSNLIGGFSGLQRGMTPGGGQEGRAPAPTGSFRGEVVTLRYAETSTVKDAMAALQDAAEEMTFGASERSKTRFSERRLERSDQASRVDAIQKIQEQMEKLPDLDMRRLSKLLATIQEMRARNEQPSREDLQQLLKDFHEDITYQFVALEKLVDALTEVDADSPVAKVASQLLLDTERAYGREIRVGLNVTETAIAYADSHGEVQQLRDFYRQSVLDHQSIRQSYANIVERYGDGDIGERIAFLLKAVGEDLQSKGPSVAPAELQTILGEVRQLEILATVREGVIEALERVDDRFKLF